MAWLRRGILLALLIVVGSTSYAERKEVDVILVPSGGQLTSFHWKTVTFSTELPPPHNIGSLSADIGQDNNFTSLVVRVGKKGIIYDVPKKILDELPHPQLHTFHLMHSTLPTTDKFWHVQLNFKYGDAIFGSAGCEVNTQYAVYNLAKIYFLADGNIEYATYDECGDLIKAVE